MSKERRLKLHDIFIDILGTRDEEDTHVYFQPPSSVQMKYPAIVYSLSRINTSYANDELYKRLKGYLVKVIDTDPDTEIPDKVAKLPLSRFSRHFTADNLNHYVYDVYY